MKLTRPIVFLDTETTGTDQMKDRIIDLAMVMVTPALTRHRCFLRFNPGIPIPPEATAVHGITDADVANCPPFRQYARPVAEFLKGKDLGGYNLRFDLPMVDEELRRCGERLDMTGVRVIDAFVIFQKKEPRKLEDAVRRYCGRQHEGAHGAIADAEASADVIEGQLAAYEDLAGMDLDALAEFARMSENKPADLAGKFYYDVDGNLRFNFGKHRDELATQHMDYVDWMLRKGEFPGSTKELLRTLTRRAG